MIPEIPSPEGVRRLLRVDILTHRHAHHTLLTLAQKCGGPPTFDLNAKDQSCLHDYVHLRDGEYHIFFANKLSLLIGIGKPGAIKLLPLILRVGAFPTKGGYTLEFDVRHDPVSNQAGPDLVAVCVETGTKKPLSNSHSQSGVDPVVQSILDELFAEARAWHHSLRIWHQQYPKLCPPAFLAPIDVDSLNPDLKEASRIMRDAIDVAMCSHRCPDNVQSLDAVLRLPAPRQDGEMPVVDCTWVASLNTTVLKIPRNDHRFAADLVEPILEREGLHDLSGFKGFAPAWDPRINLPVIGWPWSEFLCVRSDLTVSKHRQLYLQNRYGI